MFLDHFWPFLVIFARWGFFPKNPTLSQTTIYGPLTSCKVSEKTNEPIPKKLTDRQKDGRKDIRTDPILQHPSGRCRRSNIATSNATTHPYYQHSYIFLLYDVKTISYIICNIVGRLWKRQEEGQTKYFIKFENTYNYLEFIKNNKPTNKFQAKSQINPSTYNTAAFDAKISLIQRKAWKFSPNISPWVLLIRVFTSPFMNQNKNDARKIEKDLTSIDNTFSW